MGSENSSEFKKIHRSPSDEVLLTELALDHKDFTIYDISSTILVGETNESRPFGHFRGYVDHSNHEFFIELCSSTPIEIFTQSTLLNMLDVAEKENCKKFYACFRKDTANIDQYVKTFLFVGFSNLKHEEMAKISMSKTHLLLQYNLNEANDD